MRDSRVSLSTRSKVRARCLTLAAVTSISLCFSVAGASTNRSVNGDAATIAYYTKVVNKTNHVTNSQSLIGGYFFFGYTTPDNWMLGWAETKPYYAYERAVNDSQITRYVNGVVSWRTDTFATPCNVGTTCTSKIRPLRIFSSSKGDYWAYVDGPHNTTRCWNKASSAGGTMWMNKDFQVGTKNWSVDSGQPTLYKPMVRVKNVVKITSMFSFATSHQKVTEIDQNDASTLLFTKSWYFVSKGTLGAPAYNYTSTDSYPASLPVPPTINRC